MTKPKNLKVNPVGEFISKLSQLPGVIDKAKQEQHLKNLESRRLHDEQADILAEDYLERKLGDVLESMGFGNLSHINGLDLLMNEINNTLSREEISRMLMSMLPTIIKVILTAFKIIITTLISNILLKIVNFLLRQLLIVMIRLLTGISHTDTEIGIVFKLSSLFLNEDAQSVLEVQIARKLKSIESPLMKRIAILGLFSDSLWGTRIVPYFQNKFLPIKKETDRS